jgi:hypothetical protein
VAAVPPEYLAGENAAANAGDTLYLWAFVETGDRWIAVSLTEDDPATGQAYNPSWWWSGDAVQRWIDGSDLTFDDGDELALVSFKPAALGLGPEELKVGDPDYTATGVGGNHYLVGEVTLPDVWDGAYFLGVGGWGMASEGGSPGGDYVYLGFLPWGDPELAWIAGAYDIYNMYPDIVLIPEPASLFLWGLVALSAPLRLRRSA